MAEDVVEGTSFMAEITCVSMAMQGVNGLVEAAENIGVGCADQDTVLVSIVPTEDVGVG